MKNGVFITLEGGEGVGKTTVISKLKAIAQSLDREVVFTREPGGTGRAEALREILLSSGFDDSEMCVETEALIINAARSDHVENLIEPALKRGAVVICDRFADSTRAYQGDQIDQNVLEAVIKCATRDVEPNLTLLLDGDPEVLFERRQTRGQMTDRFESRDLTFHKSVRDAFLRLSARFPERIDVIDAQENEAAVLHSVLDAIKQKTGVDFGVEVGSK